MSRISNPASPMVLPISILVGVLAPGIAPSMLQAKDEPPTEARETGIEAASIGPYRVRHYEIRPKKLWKGLLEVLLQGGFPPEEVDEKKRIVKTSFVDFESKDYPGHVVELPDRRAIATGILQVARIRAGKVSFHAQVSKSPEGAELRIRARILGQGHDRVRAIPVLVDRRSTGVIESELIRRLESRLGIVSVDEAP